MSSPPIVSDHTSWSVASRCTQPSGSGPIGCQSISEDCFWLDPSVLQKLSDQAHRCLGIAAFLNEYIENFAFVVELTGKLQCAPTGNLRWLSGGQAVIKWVAVLSIALVLAVPAVAEEMEHHHDDPARDQLRWDALSSHLAIPKLASVQQGGSTVALVCLHSV